MSDDEIPREHWQEVLEAFGAQHRSAAAAVESVGPDGMRPAGSYRPLQGVRLGADGALEVIFDDDRELVRIEDPRHLRVREGGGVHWGLELESADGTLTTLRLRNAVSADMLDGMEECVTDRSAGVRGEVDIPVAGGRVSGSLSIPAGAQGLVIFAHGSGSSRFSPRNQSVAAVLQNSGFATLLMDLLTPSEERIDEVTAELRFDIPFLARRLAEVTDWVRRQPATGELSVGYFGASTGAAAALVAAADRDDVGAIVSRGGRPDLAGDALERVTAPTLLLVGGKDEVVIRLNRMAYERLRGVRKLEIIPGASHLFEEPGALEQVAERASEWFTEWLSGRGRRVA
jgi:putative phosphoribosyl transferase